MRPHCLRSRTGYLGLALNCPASQFNVFDKLDHSFFEFVFIGGKSALNHAVEIVLYVDWRLAV